MKNCCLLLGIALVAGYLGECKGADPSIYIKIKFSFTWMEMCSLGNYLKQSIGKQIVLNDNTGSTLPSNKIVLYNFDENCPKGAHKKADVYIFASKIANDNNVSNIDEEMTKKIYRVVDYYYQEKLERYLSSLYVGKIESVEIAGKNAPAESTDYTELERLYIGLGVGCIIIIVIFCTLTLVVYCKGRKNKDKNYNRGYDASHVKGSDRATVNAFPETSSAKRNEGYHNERLNDHPNYGLQTRL